MMAILVAVDTNDDAWLYFFNFKELSQNFRNVHIAEQLSIVENNNGMVVWRAFGSPWGVGVQDNLSL